MPASAPSYVSRPADEQLFNAALAGEFCYVLTTRQMGKSSLMVRTADRLRKLGIRTAIVDLTGIGRTVEDTWYLDFLSVLADKLGLAQDVEAWWHAHATLGAVLRFRSFLRDVVLTEISDQIVIFVDEIDSTLGLSFADDFFAAVRAIYNERADDAQFKRLTFIFLGVAAPADLIRDRTRTPFNIGQGILLRDFDRTDATVLQQGLDAAYPGQSKAVLDRIYHWTAGHPYLTQRLCREVVDQKRKEPWTPAAVDHVVHDLFLSDQTNREQNLQFVQDRVLRSPHRRELLQLYGKVRAGKLVAIDEQSVLQNQLKLAGLVTTAGSNLRVHNEIYRVIFDAKWITSNTPHDTNRLVAYASIAVAALVVGLAGFVLLYNSNLQRQSEQLQLEFTQVGTPAERLDRLAQLFDLQGILNTSNFDDAARRLFFEMNSRQDQLALFQVQDDRVVGVIEGVYIALADVNNSGENDALLTTMRDVLQKIGTQDAEAPRLYNEIDYWLKARQSARQNQYNYALAEYGKAIQANQDDSNPATHFERARVMLSLSSPVYSQALSDLDTALSAARKVSEAKPGEPQPDVSPTPTSTPIQVGSSSPNATLVVATVIHLPAPTVLPTILVTKGQTPVPVSTVVGQAQPQPPRPDTEPPFRSQFISYVQIASAIRKLVDSRPGLVAFLANSAESDYGNLRVAQLVHTLTPTSVVTITPRVGTQSPKVTATSIVTTVIAQDRELGRSAGGRSISMLEVGNPDGPVVVLVGSIEGDQADTSDIVRQLMDWYRSRPKQVPNGGLLYLIPSLCPDGNARSSRFNANEVDLNRNWDAGNWVRDAVVPGYPKGKPGAGGSSPFSEPETRALRDLLNQLNSSGRKVFLITLHSTVNSGSRDQVFPGYTSTGIHEASNTLTQQVGNILGYQYNTAWSYATTGEAIAWTAEQGIPSVDIVLLRNTGPSSAAMISVLEEILR